MCAGGTTQGACDSREAPEPCSSLPVKDMPRRTLLQTSALALALALAPRAAPAQVFQQAAPFRFTPDAFWLNLHQFLYVLGRAHSNAPDATRTAVVTAVPDEERGLKDMSAEDAGNWRRAVELYTSGASSLDAVFDETLIAAALDLAAARDAPTLVPTTRIDRATRAALESAAPIYRKTFWPTHLAANQRFQAGMERLLQSYQRPILTLITRAYGVAWPRNGFPVHICAYANWAGAFSTRGPLILMSSVAPDMQGTLALETAFHESMHQWDDSMLRRLQSAATTKRVAVDDWLTHAMIFYTAGEATRRAVPGHVPYAEKNGVWARGREPLRRALETAWGPWLDGKLTSEEAINDLVVRAAAPPPPTPRPRKRR